MEGCVDRLNKTLKSLKDLSDHGPGNLSDDSVPTNIEVNGHVFDLSIIESFINLINLENFAYIIMLLLLIIHGLLMFIRFVGSNKGLILMLLLALLPLSEARIRMEEFKWDPNIGNYAKTGKFFDIVGNTLVSVVENNDYKYQLILLSLLLIVVVFSAWLYHKKLSFGKMLKHSFPYIWRPLNVTTLLIGLAVDRSHNKNTVWS